MDLESPSRLPQFFGLVMIAGYLLVAITALTRSSYDIGGVFLVGPVLAVLSVPLIAKARRTEPDARIRPLFALGLLATVFAGFAHFLVDFKFYGGAADARRYSQQGAALAVQFWHGDFVPHLDIGLTGTGFIIVLTGIIYALIGPTVLGGYLVYSWLAFWGLYLSYRAFCTSMVGADYRRYALLVFFLPSLIFWSSGIGKGAWMMLCIGLALLGIARLLSGTSGAALPLLAGLAGSALARPHITALLVLALIAGVLVRRVEGANLLTPIIRVGTLAILGV
ncbi:MAG: hypothetical protein DLM61_06840, partial [Pseudonocardiales bacterium]